MRTFTMERKHDETGVSGTGVVVEGVEFSNGIVAVRWMSDIGSTVVHDNIENFIKIHLNPHPTNLTVLRFSDGTVLTQGPDGQIAIGQE